MANFLSDNKLLSLSSQLYSLLLVAYPSHFRNEYGLHMAQVFRDCCCDVYRQGKLFGLLWLWVSTIADLTVTAIHEWFAKGPGPVHYIHKIGIGLAAGMAGGIVAGLGARLAMRGVALAGGLTPNFTLNGTLVIVVIGIMLGAPMGLAFVALRRFIPGVGIWKGLAFGTLLFAIFMAPPFLFYREGEATLATPLVTVSLFAPITLAYGLTVALMTERLENRASPAVTTSITPKFIAAQLIWFLLFVAVLELGVLGVNSILRHAPLMPLAIVRAVSDLHVPFRYFNNLNRWLINLVALGYFGLSALIYWQRAHKGMARFAAFTLMLFGAAMFNTGAGYYGALVKDVASLQFAFNITQAVGLSCLLIFLYIFPDGRFAPGWTKLLAGLWGLWATIWLINPLPGSPLDPATWPEPVAPAIVIAFLGTGVGAQLHRFRRLSNPEQKQQTRWVIISFAGVVLTFALVSAAVAVFPDLKMPRVGGLSGVMTFSLYMLPWLFIPLSIGFSIRRHRLWAA